MPDIPEIELDSINGPILKLKSPDGSTVHNLDINDNGVLCLGGATAEAKMSEYQDVVVLTQTSTYGWSTKASLTTTSLIGGDYIILISFNWKTSSNSTSFLASLEVDGVEEWKMYEKSISGSSSAEVPRSKFIPISLSTGIKTIDIKFKPSKSNKLAYMSDVLMAIWRRS